MSEALALRWDRFTCIAICCWQLKMQLLGTSLHGLEFSHSKLWPSSLTKPLSTYPPIYIYLSISWGYDVFIDIAYISCFVYFYELIYFVSRFFPDTFYYCDSQRMTEIINNLSLLLHKWEVLIKLIHIIWQICMWAEINVWVLHHMIKTGIC